MGVDLKRTKDPKRKAGIAAKGIYFKYGIEHRMTGVELGEWIGINGRWTGSRVRKRFTLSFKTNQYHKETYHKFLQYIKDK